MTAGDTDDAELQEYLAKIAQPTRKRDAYTLVELMRRATGEQPRVWGSMVGFGQYHYKYASGREGDAAPVGFAARKAATTVYMLDGVGAHAELLGLLGPHKTGVGCLYLKDLAAVDLAVLEEMIKRSHATLTADTYGLRAREGGAENPTMRSDSPSK